MAKANNIATTLLAGLMGLALIAPATAAKGECPIDNRKSQAVGQSAGKKVQKAFNLYSEEDTAGALEVLLEIDAKDDFDKAYVSRFIGNLYAEQGKIPTALKYMKIAVDSDQLGGTDHAASLKLYADLLMMEKQFSKAVPVYQDWMEFTCKEDADVYTRIGVAYSETKQYDKVIPMADKAIALNKEPKKGPFQLKLTSYYNTKQYQKSIDVLETMIPLFIDDKRLWVQLAQFYLLVEDYKKALATYNISYLNGYLETDGNVRRLAQLLSQNGSHYRAAKIWEKHMNEGLIPTNEKNLKDLAGFFQRAKEHRTAAKYFGKAADVNKDGELYLKQGILLVQAERHKESIPVFEKALKAGIKNPGEAHIQMMLAHLSLKQLKSAYKYAKLAKKDSKTKKHATSYEGFIQEKAKLYGVTL
ncbi:tetratricopeptide repeat protein [Paraferrimonas sedimenticola]|uniref:Tetratricopeptide repeat-containing protein n=1 Tax=Paraferrimonas sedimenticola TaxID=375674 RepID=A0AA37RXL3_9GAMM|nr:tetratricopeptide repeat protein [Paraferrimonas sedimenticola]GLP96923.1 hypothetical protein GCM10007895_22290 [Paraferrimonas sedimenticola]